MFCVQCEQTIRTPAGNGCSYAQGMCGKTAETSDLQDLLIAALQGLSAWAVKAREYGIINHDVDSFAPRAFFSTLTNVNFDSPRIVGYSRESIALRDALKAQAKAEPDAKKRIRLWHRVGLLDGMIPSSADAVSIMRGGRHG